MNHRSSNSMFLVLLLLAGCMGSSTGPSDSGPALIRLHVTGGFAGVDYTLYLDGHAGSLVGESCVSGCDFQEGEILRTVTRGQATYLADRFRDAGIHTLRGTDFGIECCDQFHYDLTFTDGEGTSRVQGSAAALPAELADAVSQVHALMAGVVPVVVDPQTHPDQWPGDRAVIEELSLAGSVLAMRVSYGGGCAVHDFVLVAWGGWMESSPVQVRAFLSHDGNDDPCDAVVSSDLTLDLRPLKVAYEESYGTGQPGATTLIISLANPDQAGSQPDYRIDYVF